MPTEIDTDKNWRGPGAAFWAAFILTISLWITLFLYAVIVVLLVPAWYLETISWPALKAFNALLSLFKITPLLLPPVMVFILIAYDKSKEIPPSWVFQLIGMFLACAAAYFFFCPGYFM